MRSLRLARVVGPVIASAVLAASLAAPPQAAAAPAKLLTVAARWCNSYADISANEARNNIMESLKDLGQNNPYGSTDQMDPDSEARNQPKCEPLAGWRFTLGNGYESRVLNGVWGSLSKVTGVYSTAITTLASTPLLTNQSAATTRTLAGASTITLTPEQEGDASRSDLWVMGGTLTAPVGVSTEYAFGALRCGVDNLNGDNVEFVSYPSGVTHVFCFAYYVKPPPTSGTIIVRKELRDAPANTPTQTVGFTGNISFEQNQKFTVTTGPNTPGSTTFYRAGGADWSFSEDPPSRLTAFERVSCAKTGNSTITANQAARKVTVSLAAGDVVTCTFVNVFKPPAGLVLRKLTIGGIGTFGFDVQGPESEEFDVTTTREEISAAGPTLDLPAGDYDVSETPPPAVGGRWSLQSVSCDGQPVNPTDGRVRLRLEANDSRVCTFTNRFIHAGNIRVHKATFGAIGTTTFYIVPRGELAPGRFIQRATTTEQGEAVLADGQDTTSLPLGRYTIQELTPSIGDTPGTWTLAGVQCNGKPVPSAQGEIDVTLTAAEPEIDCTFGNVFTPRATPEPEPQPLPGSPPSTPVPLDVPPVSGVAASESEQAVPDADLEVTKTATPRTISLGQRIRYRITVRNRGPAPAHDVTLFERETYGNRPLRPRTTKGRCTGSPPRACTLGTLAPGERVTVTVDVRPRRTGLLRNTVAANTSTHAANLRGQSASETVRVRPRTGPRVAG